MAEFLYLSVSFPPLLILTRVSFPLLIFSTFVYLMSFCICGQSWAHIKTKSENNVISWEIRYVLPTQHLATAWQRPCIDMHYKNVSLRWENKRFWAKIDHHLLSGWFLAKLWTKTWYLFMDCVTNISTEHRRRLSAMWCHSLMGKARILFPRNQSHGDTRYGSQ